MRILRGRGEGVCMCVGARLATPHGPAADGCSRQDNPLWNRHEVMMVPNLADWRQLLWQYSQEDCA